MVQTQVVLKQAWTEGIKLCLVINKVDRLITELQYSPTEAYQHLQQVLEQVNAVAGSLFSSEVMEAKSSKPPTEPLPCAVGGEEVVYDWSDGLQDTDDSSLYFCPEQGNVIFASALDGWGFGVSDFASMYAKKLGLSERVLQKTLWGDFYLNSKTKRIFRGAQARGKKPLFVQFILDNLWEVYRAVLVDRNKELVDKIVSSMQLKISARDSRHTNPKVLLFAMCSQWLPLALAVLRVVVTHLPSPLQLSEERVERLLCRPATPFQALPHTTQLLKEDFMTCSIADSAAVIVFITKLLAMDRLSLPQRSLTEVEIAERRVTARQRHQAKMAALEDGKEEQLLGSVEPPEEPQTEPESGSVLLAFSRVFSGVLKRGQTLYVLQPNYNPQGATGTILDESLPPHVSTFTVGDVYVLMGRGLVPVGDVPAGNVVGVAGLEESVVKTATLSSTLACPAFGAMDIIAAPIVRVAIEPVHTADLRALMRGLKLLNQSDPSVEVSVQETGEHILASTGEVHLQKCLDDLEKVYARVKLKVSTPIIPFRETVVAAPTVDMVNEEISADNEVKVLTRDTKSATASVAGECSSSRGEGVVIRTANKACTLHLVARPLPAACVSLLESRPHLLRALSLLQTGASKKEPVEVSRDTVLELEAFRTALDSALTSSGSGWEGVAERIWCFGPRQTGPNLLVNGVEGYDRPSLWQALQPGSRQPLREFDNSVAYGFQLAALSGPLCEEPMHGVCFTVKRWDYRTDGEQLKTPAHPSTGDAGNSSEAAPRGADSYGPFSGQLISATKEGCRRSFLAQSARLMAAMYSSHILATADVLGKVYSVLGRRNGRVLADEMKEGSAMFTIQALLPVAESFGFAEEIRKKTSGLANPQLIFSHWEVIANDPFWVPSTEEELLHFGEKADSENIARKYMNAVRKRKGLHVDEKIVEHGEKQRTFKKNK